MGGQGSGKKPFSEKDYVSIYPTGRFDRFSVQSNSDMLKNEYVILAIDTEKMIITTPSIDSSKKSLRPSNITDNIRVVISSGVELPTGQFEADQDESNEDQLVIYFDNE